MSIIANAKILAEIAELGSRAYGVLVDKGRAMADRDKEIKELKRQIAELKAKAGIP